MHEDHSPVATNSILSVVSQSFVNDFIYSACLSMSSVDRSTLASGFIGYNTGRLLSILNLKVNRNV